MKNERIRAIVGFLFFDGSVPCDGCWWGAWYTGACWENWVTIFVPQLSQKPSVAVIAAPQFEQNWLAMYHTIIINYLIVLSHSRDRGYPYSHRLIYDGTNRWTYYVLDAALFLLEPEFSGLLYEDLIVCPAGNCLNYSEWAVVKMVKTCLVLYAAIQGHFGFTLMENVLQLHAIVQICYSSDYPFNLHFIAG